MLKKTILLFGFFGFFLILNFILVNKIRNRVKKNTHIAIILSELDSINSEFFTSDDLSNEQNSKIKDRRVAILKAFFRKHDSPLYNFADVVVANSDKYGLDYRLLPAISMQESGACKVIPNNSHNCWGWGIYGNKITRFSSYPEAIETVSRGLKTHYIDKGLTTPEAIMQKYTPSSKGSWAFGVNTFLNVLE